MNRAERRAKAEQAKARAKRQLRLMWWGSPVLPPSERAVGLHATTPKLCSCYGCGNPRKWFRELTLQEQRWNERQQAELEEWSHRRVSTLPLD
jgi:hypothetical protein